MALLKKLERNSKRHSVHKETDAYYDVFSSEGKKYIQIDTYGSEDREVPGKVSQSLQIDVEVAKQLVNILKFEFGI